MHLSTNASTGSVGGTIKEYAIAFNLFLKKALQWVSRWTFELISSSSRERQQIARLLRKDNGFPRDNRVIERKGGIYTVIRYLLKCRSKVVTGMASVKLVPWVLHR